MGKGSSARPFTDRKVFEENFDRIFGKKEKDGKDVTNTTKPQKTKK